MPHPSPYVGRFCYRSSIQLFLSRSLEEWVADMKANFSKVTGHPLETSQICAWKDEHAALHQALSRLPKEYHQRQIIFEYVMPYRKRPSADDPGVRADVILLSEKTVTILEFKQHYEEENAVNIQRQLLKYRRRIQEWHAASTGMRKTAIAVLTSETNFREKRRRCTFCSPDMLADELLEHVDGKHMPKAKIESWLRSEWNKQ